MPYVIIEPQNLPCEEIEDLARAIRDIDGSLDTRFARAREQRGYGVTWWEVVYIWLMAAGGVVDSALGTKIVEVPIDWARNRFKHKPGKRPKYVAIHGPDGKVIRSVLLTDEAADPEDRPAAPRDPPSIDE